MDVIVWLAAMFFFLAVEAGTVGLVSIWFAVGSLGGLIAAALGASLPVQIIVCVVVSGASLAAVRPLVKKYMNPKLVKTNVDAIVGKHAIVTEDISNLMATGAVKVGSVTWTARSTNGRNIPKGSVIRVDRVEGVKLYVSLMETPVSKV